MTRSRVLGAILVFGTCSIGVAAYQGQAGRAGQAGQAAPAGPRAIDMVKLKDNFYVLTSSTPGDSATFSGGNVSVFITDGGVTVVDTKLAGWGQAMLDKIKTVTTKPVTTIINTHTHGDHTGNNNLFGTAVTIVAQANTKSNMEKMAAFKDDNAKYLPSKTFADTMTLGSGNDRIELRYFGAGHTSGDAWVYFPALRVLATGDMFAWKDAPLCDRANGGSCVAFPQTLSKGLAAIKNVDTVVPGHSPMMTLKDLDEYQRFNADLVRETQAAMKAGKSVDDAAASIRVSERYPGYQSSRVKAAVQVIYDESK